MLRTASLLSLFALGCMASLASAEGTATDPQTLPCNALCRRWMAYGEGTAPEPPPAAAERQTTETPAAIVASPLPPPTHVVTRRFETPVLRPSSGVPAIPKPPAKLRRAPRTLEARRVPQTATPHPTRTVETVALHQPSPPAPAAIVMRAEEPGAVPSRALSAGPLPTIKAALAQPAAVPTHGSDPARTARPIDFVLPLLEQPSPPVIVVPTPVRGEVFPPAFDVIATLLLSAPPHR